MLNEFIDAGNALSAADEKAYAALILTAYHGHLDTAERLLRTASIPVPRTSAATLH
jgi:hypothetical protein